MKWPWTKKQHAPLVIPSYPVEIATARVEVLRGEPMVVEEHDTSAMTMTGVHEAWKRMS
jgi:hypothetical protein